MIIQNDLAIDLQADLKWIHQELDTIKDPVFIEAIKNMLKYRKKASTEGLSIEEYNIKIDASIAQIESGKTYTHQEMGDRIKQWAKNKYE
ncbi:MAG: hypothetical protein WDZ45_14250 [Flavobacteriaceae bacterium]